MPNALLTREELEALINGVVREAPKQLELKATGTFRHEHDELARRRAEGVNLASGAAHSAPRSHFSAPASIPLNLGSSASGATSSASGRLAHFTE